MKSPRTLSLQSYTWKKASFLFLVCTQNTIHGVVVTQQSQLQEGHGYTPCSFTHTGISAVLLLGGAAAFAQHVPKAVWHSLLSQGEPKQPEKEQHLAEHWVRNNFSSGRARC